MSEKEYIETFTKNLKHQLTKKGKTQTELSRDLGLSKTTVSSWFNGYRMPRMDKIDMLCNYFNVSRSDLLEDKSTNIPQNNKAENDIGDTLERTLNRLQAYQDGLMFLGEPLDNTTQELLKASLENSIRIAKINARKETDPTMPIAAHNDDADDEEQQRLMREDIDEL